MGKTIYECEFLQITSLLNKTYACHVDESYNAQAHTPSCLLATY